MATAENKVSSCQYSNMARLLGVRTIVSRTFVAGLFAFDSCSGYNAFLCSLVSMGDTNKQVKLTIATLLILISVAAKCFLVRCKDRLGILAFVSTVTTLSFAFWASLAHGLGTTVCCRRLGPQQGSLVSSWSPQPLRFGTFLSEEGQQPPFSSCGGEQQSSTLFPCREVEQQPPVFASDDSPQAFSSDPTEPWQSSWHEEVSQSGCTAGLGASGSLPLLQQPAPMFDSLGEML